MQDSSREVRFLISTRVARLTLSEKRALNGLLLTAKRVEVRETTDKDPWGRMVLEVYADGVYVAEYMKAKGHERPPIEKKSGGGK